jgi:hypothetical protein
MPPVGVRETTRPDGDMTGEEMVPRLLPPCAMRSDTDKAMGLDGDVRLMLPPGDMTRLVRLGTAIADLGCWSSSALVNPSLAMRCPHLYATNAASEPALGSFKDVSRGVKYIRYQSSAWAHGDDEHVQD